MGLLTSASELKRTGSRSRDWPWAWMDRTLLGDEPLIVMKTTSCYNYKKLLGVFYVFYLTFQFCRGFQIGFRKNLTML